MQELLDTNIKDVIEEYPAVGEVLQEFKIACVTCNVGTCLLRDIIEIHNLDPEQEKAVLTRVAKAVFPDREVVLPTITRQPPSKNVKLSPPLLKLVREHDLIRKLIVSIPSLVEELEENAEIAWKLIGEGLDFIRSFADQFHHAKEEDILFGYFDENVEMFQVMRADHEQARKIVRLTQEALDTGDAVAAASHLHAYRELLDEHIQKEDEVLYPWIDRSLTVSQVGELNTKFSAIDREFEAVTDLQEGFIGRLVERYGEDQRS